MGGTSELGWHVAAQNKNFNQRVGSVDPAPCPENVADDVVALQGDTRQPGPPRGARTKRINELGDHGLIDEGSRDHTMYVRSVNGELGTDSGICAHQLTVPARSRRRTQPR